MSCQDQTYGNNRALNTKKYYLILMTHQNRRNNNIQSSFIYALAILLIFNLSSYKVHASENETTLNKSKIIIANKYAERFCSAKADHFFEGLDNEKTLKYSYFKYIGLQSDEMFLKDLKKLLINQIREKCFITNEEERELNEFLVEANR